MRGRLRSGRGGNLQSPSLCAPFGHLLAVFWECLDVKLGKYSTEFTITHIFALDEREAGCLGDEASSCSVADFRTRAELLPR